MKHTLLNIAALLLTVSASAEVVDYSTAEHFAGSFFASGKVNSVQMPQPSGVSQAQVPAAYHIFNNSDGGWIIVAGDDVASPVLAYSRTGSIDPSSMNPSVSAWLSTAESRILKARKEGRKSLVPQKNWAANSAGFYGEGKVIDSPLWGQGAPFNNLCPLDNGYRSVTGCVATAMAIVMRHNKYPAHGTGYLDSYVTNSKEISVEGYSIDDHLYDWDNMPYEYTSSATAQQKEAVAQLMHDCGVMVRMDYSSSGSGAYSENILPELVEHMGYAKSAKYLSHANFNHVDWFILIASEINKGRLVLYDGVDITGGGGHEFVCDGYDSAGNLHINWGWNGSLNGFFSVSYLGDSKAGVYAKYDNILIGLVPEYESDPGFSPNLTFYNGNGLSVQGEVAKGSTFHVSADYLANIGYGKFTGNLYVCLVDKYNKIRETISNPIYVSISDMSIVSVEELIDIPCTIANSTPRPDDGIAMACECNGEWAIIGSCDWAGTTPMSRAGIIDAPVINVRDNISVGENVYFSLNPGHIRPEEITWYYDGKLCPKGYAVAQTGLHTIKAVVRYSDPNCSDTVSLQIEVK